MTFELVPFVSVGPIKFGSSAREVRRAMGRIHRLRAGEPLALEVVHVCARGLFEWEDSFEWRGCRIRRLRAMIKR